MQNTWTVLRGQSLYDLCLQLYGTVDLLPNGESAIFKLINDNNIDSINTTPAPGQRLNFDPTLTNDNSVITLIGKDQIIYVTDSFIVLPEGLATDDGILIETDGGLIITVD